MKQKRWIGCIGLFLLIAGCTITSPVSLPSPTVIPPQTLVPTQSLPISSNPSPTNIYPQITQTVTQLVPSPTPVTPPPKNIILIIVDTLRADHVSAYGYTRNTTPNLDTFFGSQGVRFNRVISTAPWTCPSVAAMLTGRTPTSLGTTYATRSHSVPQNANTLAEYLKDKGYDTAGFVSTYCNKARLGFSQGFNYYDDQLTDQPSSDKARAADINKHAMQWLDNTWLPQSKGETPLFLFLYYFDPHAWYDPPSPYDTLFDNDYIGKLTPAVYKDGEDTISGKIVPTDRDIHHLLAMYDGEISYWDAYLGEMMTFLQNHHLLENSLIILTSDHGELFGEYGGWAHGSSLKEELLRVPLLMRYSGVIPPGTSVQSTVQNYDLMPTILDWAGVTLPGDLQAISLRALAMGAPDDIKRSVFSEVDAITDKKDVLYWTAPRISSRSIENNGWKLVHFLNRPDLDELYLVQPSSLYERENQIELEPDRAQILLQYLSGWFGITFLPVYELISMIK